MNFGVKSMLASDKPTPRRYLLAVMAILPALSASAAVPTVLAPLVGTWTGSGSVKLENGQSEGVRCKAYYTEKGDNVGVALRCASAASKIDLRATLATAGTTINGTWEERQFNAAGSLTGAVNGNRMTLDMDGGGLRANIVVATTGAKQTLSLTTDAGSFRTVSIAFARD